jgi:hypothetical protein
VTADADRDVLALHQELGRAPMSCCISPPAFTASSTVGKIARISSPMVLMTVPRLRPVASRMISTQSWISSRARWSPSCSYRRVLPTTSAKTTATSVSVLVTLAEPLGARSGHQSNRLYIIAGVPAAP